MPYRIAVIDDNQDVLLMLGFALEQAGFVFAGTRGASAFWGTLDPEHLPDAIVLDLILPDANGYQVIEQLRADPATRAIPIIVMTGQTEAIYRRMSADLGVAQHLTKPFHPETLVTRLQSLFSPPAARVEASPGAAYAR